MRLNSERLEAFFEVVNQGSVAKAAKSLGLSQPAVSHRLTKLEDELGETIFSKNGRKLELTTKGRMLLQFCKQRMDWEDDFLSSFAGSSKEKNLTGNIRIGCYSSIRPVVTNLLAKLIHNHPKIRFELIVRETYELEPMVKSGQADYVFLDSQTYDPALTKTYLGDEYYVMAHAKGKKPEIYLDHDPNDDLTLKYLKLWGKPTDKFERCFVGDMTGLLEAVEQGIGKGVLPLHLLKEWSKIKIMRNAPKMAVPVYMLSLNRVYTPALFRVFESVVLEQDILKSSTRD